MPSVHELTALYRFYAPNGQLLYVGITANPWSRFEAHQCAAWAPMADPQRTRVRWYRTRRAAKRAETRAIRSERPAYNQAEMQGAARPVQLAFALPLPHRDWISLRLKHRWGHGSLRGGGDAA
jgi:predicted GIY-YIG superfamily endonuclease